jgi:reverse gyrase
MSDNGEAMDLSESGSTPTLAQTIPATHMQVLEAARRRAQAHPEDYPMYSQAAMHRMGSRFTELTGKTLYDWQRDVGEALLLKLDCTVMAPTSAGKTTPMILPLLAAEQGSGQMGLIISPLKLLQYEQV